MAEELRTRVAKSLTKAREKLDGARAARVGGFHADAVSRAYYAIFHAAKATLLPRHAEPRTHRGLAALVHPHLVLPGLLDRDLEAKLAQARDLRENGDYEIEAHLTRADADAVIADAEKLLAAFESILEKDGLA